jgi:hypothetical protein
MFIVISLRWERMRMRRELEQHAGTEQAYPRKDKRGKRSPLYGWCAGLIREDVVVPTSLPGP